jgi:hypothetical protein
MNSNAMPFVPFAGFTIYQAKHADIPLLQQEDDKHCTHQIFREFLGLDTSNLLENNGTPSIHYKNGNIIRENKLFYSLKVQKKVYNTRFFCHFFTEDEIFIFKQRWFKKTGEQV